MPTVRLNKTKRSLIMSEAARRLVCADEDVAEKNAHATALVAVKAAVNAACPETDMVVLRRHNVVGMVTGVVFYRTDEDRKKSRGRQEFCVCPRDASAPVVHGYCHRERRKVPAEFHIEVPYGFLWNSRLGMHRLAAFVEGAAAVEFVGDIDEFDPWHDLNAATAALRAWDLARAAHDKARDALLSDVRAVVTARTSLAQLVEDLPWVGAMTEELGGAKAVNDEVLARAAAAIS